MAILLIIILACAVLLGLIGSLPAWASGFLFLGSLAALAVQTYFRKQEQIGMNRRRQYLSASWGIQVRHLGGLPMPLNARGNLFLLPDQMLLETDYDHLSIRHDELKEILLTRADQIRRIPDQQLCRMLKAGSCRSFSALREMIRRGGGLLRRISVLLLVIQRAGEDAGVLILAADVPPQRLSGLLHQPALAATTQVRLRLG